jgi:hypothetical protein
MKEWFCSFLLLGVLEAPPLSFYAAVSMPLA